MEKLPDSAYVALNALKKYGWLLLTQNGETSHGKEFMAETEEQLRVSEPWTSLIQEEWAKGSENRIKADAEWLESKFNAADIGSLDVPGGGEWLVMLERTKKTCFAEN